MSISEAFLNDYYLIVAVVLFVIGFAGLVFHPNLLKKMIGLTIMDSAVYLLLTASGFVRGRLSPVVTDPSSAVRAVDLANPIPSGLVLTGIVISVGVTAFLLALTQRLYQRYHSLDLDQIMMMAKKGAD